MALLGKPLLSHVYIKIMMLSSIIHFCAMICSSNSFLLCARDHTLLRKMLARDSQQGVSFSLALSPPLFTHLCSWSYRHLRALQAGRAGLVASVVLALFGVRQRLLIKLSELWNLMSGYNQFSFLLFLTDDFSNNICCLHRLIILKNCLTCIRFHKLRHPIANQ